MALDHHQKITVYSPESGLRRPWHLLKSIFQDIYSSYSLAWRFFVRNQKALYRQSVLGLVWAFIPPLITSLVWIFLNGQSIINVDDTGVPYPVFVLTSVLLWSVFAQSLTAPITAMQQGKSIIVKINFPKEALILASLFQIIFDFMIKAILIVLIFIVFRTVPAGTAWLGIVGAMSLVIFGLALGLLLLPIGMLYSDIPRVLTAITPFWMLLTPVIYPTPRGELGKLLNKFNPVSPLLSATRDWLLNGSMDFLVPFLWVLGLSIIVFFFGLIMFRLTIPIIIERSGS